MNGHIATALVASALLAVPAFAQPIRDFDFTRIHDVLERYWMSNMKAKALLMAFE